VSSDIKILTAVATKGSGLINEHFGHAKEFQIYELSTSGAKFVGHRRVDLYCQGGFGDEDSLETVIRAINDCHAVFVAKIGGCPKGDLAKAGIEAVDEFAHEFIEKSAITWFKAYLEKVNSGEIVHEARGDAEIRQGALLAAAD
jgi:nitrogen fixation protein NifB